MTAAALPRLKPAPIPPLRPIPEYAADPELRAVYEETKRVFQVPWMGVVAMAFARYPNFYAELWRGVGPMAQSDEFVTACARLRAKAEAEADAFRPASLVAPLRADGFADRELDDIRTEIEIFSHGNMPYLLLASAARTLLEGGALSDATAATPFEGRHGVAAPGARLVLMEPHHADAPTQAVYDDVKATLGLPFVNTDYRSLARWPRYFARAWSDLKPFVGTPEYAAATQAIHETAVAAAQTAPNPAGLTSESLLAAARADGDAEETLAVVRLFQWLLPGLLLNVALFRAQLPEND